MTASALVEEGEIIQTTMQNCHCVVMVNLTRFNLKSDRVNLVSYIALPVVGVPGGAVQTMYRSV